MTESRKKRRDGLAEMAFPKVFDLVMKDQTQINRLCLKYRVDNEAELIAAMCYELADAMLSEQTR